MHQVFEVQQSRWLRAVSRHNYTTPDVTYDVTEQLTPVQHYYLSILTVTQVFITGCLTHNRLTE